MAGTFGRVGLGGVVLGALVLVASCASDRAARVAEETPDASVARSSRVAELRTQFAQANAPVIGAGVASRFDMDASQHAHAVIPPEAKRGVRRTASVALPALASGDVRLEDDTTHVAVRFRLRGASDVPFVVDDGIALYRRAAGGSDIVHRVHAEGTEDYVAFDTQPDTEVLAYDVDVSRAAGLRLVSNVLEFLDEGGAPRLRVATPWVVDAKGARHEARLDVDGCAYDTNPAGPWGRALTRPGASSCGVRVAWSGVVYPALVDPTWTATGSMAALHSNHTATVLTSGVNAGKVLIAGAGNGGSGASVAELYDGTSSFATTGTMTYPRYAHTATLLTSGVNAGKVLMAGGYAGGAGWATVAEIFDGAGTFTVTGTMNVARRYHTGTLLPSGKVLYAGGDSISGYVSSAELFDGTSTFALTSNSMGDKRAYHTATLLPSGSVLIAGGGYNFPSTADLFDGGALTFAPTGSMTGPRGGHTATLLTSGANAGKVLLTGGFGATGVISTAELFNGTSAFAATGSMAAVRYNHTATLLTSGANAGKVLVAGGETTNGPTGTAGAELFDGTSMFMATGSMNAVRYFHAATLLTAGSSAGAVLVTGGYNGSSFLQSAEVAFVGPGGACTANADCVSGICDDTVCCAAACPNGGVCQQCAAGTGACTTVTGMTDPGTCTSPNTCSATGQCLLATGQASGSGAACATGFAADGYCCNTACGASCDVCAASLGASANGTCTTAPLNYPGNPACGAGYVCDGVATSCFNPCVADADCVAGDYCNAAGACVARKVQGTACNLAADCKVANCRACVTGNCVDGVCCNSACGGCNACTATLQVAGGVDGACGPALAGTNPHGTCVVDPGFPTDCKSDGKCDGAGACRVNAPSNTACGATSCMTGQVTGLLCNGGGTCAMSAPQSCGLYNCAGNTCGAMCSSDAACTANAYCTVMNACAPQKSSGAMCSAGHECASGNCVDGVCCNTACQGQCQACDVAGNLGTCTLVMSGAPHGQRAACTAAGTTCGGQCNGTGMGCAFPPVATACGSTCTNALEVPSTCDGAGACAAGMATTCSGNFQCDAATNKCKTACATNADCTMSFVCAADHTCAPPAPQNGATCSDDKHTLVMTGAESTHDCAPFNCLPSGQCIQVCQTVADCVTPSVCDANGKCVAPPSSGSSGGCAIATERGDAAGGSGVWLAFGALAACAARGRRRRRER